MNMWSMISSLPGIMVWVDEFTDLSLETHIRIWQPQVITG